MDVTLPLDLRALNDATSQRDRLLGAPAPHRVEVDGHSLADLLAFAAEYGALIRFYDLNNMPDQDWSVFFLGDESIGLALRARLDVRDIEVEFDALLERMRDADTLEARLENVAAATGVLLRLIRILGQAQADPSGLEHAVAALATSPRRDLLAAPALRLAAHLGGISAEQRLRHDVTGLANGWFDQFVDFLGDLVHGLTTALEQGRADALARLDASLRSKSHPPQSGLYDAFAILFGHAQASINRFPARLIDFYTTDVLRQISRTGQADSLFLTFTPAKGVARVDLPKETPFSAGVDSDGETIAYALDSALTVDAAAISALRMVTATAQPAVPGAPPALAQIFSSEVTLAATAPAIPAPVLLFGATREATDGAMTTTLASLGFAIASPTLWLTGGARTVTLSLVLTGDSVAALTPLLASIGEAAGGMPPAAVLAALIEAGLALRYTTTGGWIEVTSFAVMPPTAEGDTTYTLTFTLDANADGLVPQATAPATDIAAPDPDTPMILASLVQSCVTLGTSGSNVEVYPYAALALVVLSQLSVAVSVTGLTSLEVETSAGPVDTSQPFAPFGSPPVQYAALAVSAPELFAKPISSLSLTLDWFGLPVNSTGFRGYYSGYVIDADGRTRPPGTLFDNSSFRGQIDVVNAGSWTIDPATQHLFATDIGNAGPDADVLLPQIVLSADVVQSAPPAYYDPSQSWVRLTLTEPSYAFGNTLYSANVMAASVQLTAAASACAQQCGQADMTAATLIDPVIAANATATDATLADSVAAAAELAVANLDGAALQAIDEAIAACDVDETTRSGWRDSLAQALGETQPGGLVRRLLHRSKGPNGATVHDSLRNWLAAWIGANGATFTPSAANLAAAATAMEAAGDSIGAVVAAAEGKAATVARPMTAAGLRETQVALGTAIGQDSQSCIQKCLAANPVTLPNQPWLPMAACLAVSYTAATALPLAAGAVSAATATYYHLRPFGTISAVAWQSGGEMPLLAPVEAAGSLYIGLSATVDAVSLLFRLAAPASGWPTDTPAVDWAVASIKPDADGWEPLAPLRDTTNNFRNTGIVSLPLDDSAPATPLWLRASVPNDTSAFPELAGLVTNAANAHWIGPGAADTLGTPLPAGTVTKPVSPIAALGSIDQPLPSAGGRPRLGGKAFTLWMAERLRHKDRGVQAWDYARLILAAFPSLWQVAIVPASDGSTMPAAGNVWIVPVPGPETPAIADRTIPSNDATMLSDIADLLASRISPFIQLTITNPPYLRLIVDADIIFTAADSVDACIQRLNEELIAFLSPWPTPALGPRPDDYYTRRQVAHFIRHRPYVLGIRNLYLVPDADANLTGWHYLTSAKQHRLSGSAPPATSSLRPARLALSAPGAAE